MVKYLSVSLLLFQIQHFKDVELAKMRMEEKRKLHEEFDKLKQELEKTYEMKAKSLMDREKNAIDRLQKQQEVDYAQHSDVPLSQLQWLNFKFPKSVCVSLIECH